MTQNISDEHTSRINLHVGIKIAAVLMIVFGLAEVATGFTYNFIGVVGQPKPAWPLLWVWRSDYFISPLVC